MSNAPIVQVNYNVLGSSAKQFGNLADQEDDIIRRVKSKVENLRNGGWEGEGVEAFLGEMDGTVLPSLKRLHHALLQTQSTLQKIMQTMEEAEQDALRYFQDDGEGSLGKVTKDFEQAAKSPELEFIGGSDMPRPFFRGARGEKHFSFAIQEYLEGTKTFKEALTETAGEPPSYGKLEGTWELWNNKTILEGGMEKTLLDNEFAKVRASTMEFETSGGLSASFDGKAAAGIQGSAGLYAARLQGAAEYGALKGSFDAYAGATASGEAKIVFDPKTNQFSGKLEGEAFVGLEAKGKVAANITDFATVGAEGSVSLGLGIQGKADIGWENNKLKFDIGGKAALGLGAGGRFTGEVDVKKMTDDGVKAAQNFAKSIGFKW